MIIKTITCHDVYNAGAGLQAYALEKYLSSQGHDVEIIDYRPGYLSRHYSLTYVNNPKYNVPFVKQLYLAAKLPKRIIALSDPKKHKFDLFKKTFLKTTNKQYHSFEELKQDCPQADLYIAGSDQIWNPLFQNGKDPAFFLQFVKEKKKCVSYAASFSVNSIEKEDELRIGSWLKSFNAITVRESSALPLLEKMGFQGEKVCDPVFLIDKAGWEQIAVLPKIDSYILVYDFDNNEELWKKAKVLSKATNKKIVSLFSSKYADYNMTGFGPREFLGAIINSDYVVSNSFHATAFSVIFQKSFFVANRQEGINSRMFDFLNKLDLLDRMLDYNTTTDLKLDDINWSNVKTVLSQEILNSKEYLKTITS